MVVVNPLETCQSTSLVDPAKLCDVKRLITGIYCSLQTSVIFRRDVFHLCLFEISPDNEFEKKVIGGFSAI